MMSLHLGVVNGGCDAINGACGHVHGMMGKIKCPGDLEGNICIFICLDCVV